MTATAEKLAAHAEDLPEGSFRRKVLEGAQRFKSAWVELGRLLVEVKRKELWRGWGYPSFERYCSKELFIRSATADKLTASYGFLERHEPRLVHAAGDEAKAPPFEVIEVLSRAEASGRLSDGGWRELRDEVLERPPTPAAMTRKLAEKFGPPPPPPPRPEEERLARLAQAARRLADACHAEGAVPEGVAQRAADLAGDLEALLEK
ncbi:hypothetical protein [Anaeromyxobacter oryzisoli]|jgi:hypothetical protein|uniref:hypothetical protein n=1 Tax=Anaeromyxobacter oryzisoli TaxID=2925408 RepID=UPI001F560ECB|nr:hypothetical protein [Anaeromyxobacter sp. SG63]